MGLLKMDFLGLRTLSIIERAKKLIREGLSEEEIWEAVGRAEFTARGNAVACTPLDLDRLSYDDPAVFSSSAAARPRACSSLNPGACVACWSR
jgi:DNA polymerase-3 subunit alpha